MYLQSRLKELNSRSRSTSPFPFSRQPRGHSGLSGQDASLMSRPVEGVGNQAEPGSSRARLVPSAVNSVGSWEMSMVSICSVCDVILRHGLQAESSTDSGRRSSQNFSDDPTFSRYLSHGTSLQETSDSSLSSRFSSRGSLFIEKELYESQCYTKELEQKVARLQTQCTTLQYVSSIPLTCRTSCDHRQAYDSLLDALQTHKSQTPCPTDIATAPVRSNYPHIKFWTKQEWMEYYNNDVTSTSDKTRGKSRAAQGVNVTMRFAELEDGTVVDGHVAGNIRRAARSTWVHLANNGEAPSKWRSASMLVIRSYHEEMYRRFPFLQYCDDNWKAEQIAMDNYPSWYNSWCKKKDKAESSANIKDEQEPLVSMKRPNDATLDTESKRMKITPQPASVTIQVDDAPVDSFAVSNSDSTFMV